MGSLALALGYIRTPAPQAVCGRRHHQMASPVAHLGLYSHARARGLDAEWRPLEWPRLWLVLDEIRARTTALQQNSRRLP